MIAAISLAHIFEREIIRPKHVVERHAPSKPQLFNKSGPMQMFRPVLSGCRSGAGHHKQSQNDPQTMPETRPAVKIRLAHFDHSHLPLDRLAHMGIRDDKQ